MTSKRPPRAKAPPRNDKNQLSFIDQLVAVATNLNVLSTATFTTLTVVATQIDGVRSNYGGVLQRFECFIVYALLAFLTIRAFKTEVERANGLDEKVAARRLYRIGAAGLVVLLGFLFYGEVKARVLDWEHVRREQQRERDRQQKEQDDIATHKVQEERKAERAKCEQDRKWVIAKAEKERPGAHDALVACTEAYERGKKTAEDTVAQRCRSEVNALKSIERKKQTAEAKRCDIFPSK